MVGNFAGGLFLAITAGQGARAAAFRRALVFFLAGFAPPGIVLMAIWPAWSWMGLVDGPGPVWLRVAAVLAYPMAGVAGFLVGASPGRRQVAIALLIASLAALAVMAVLGRHRLLSILDDPRLAWWAWVMVAGGLSAGGTFIYAASENLRDSERPHGSR